MTDKRRKDKIKLQQTIIDMKQKLDTTKKILKEISLKLYKVRLTKDEKTLDATRILIDSLIEKL